MISALKALALLALVALGAAALLDPLLSLEPVQAWCAGRIESRLQRKIQFSALSAGPWRGLVVEGLAVSRGRDFEQGAALEIASARIRPRWLPLLAGRLELAEVFLAGPRARLLRSPLEALPAALERLGDVPIASLRVRAGRLSWPGADGDVEVGDLSAAVSGIAPGASGSLKAAFRWQAPGTSSPPARCAAETLFSLGRDYRVGASSGSVTLLGPALGASRFERARLEWTLDQTGASPALARGRARLAADGGVLALPGIVPSTATWAGAFWAPIAELSRAGKADLRRPRPLASLKASYTMAGGETRAIVALKGPGLAVDTRPQRRSPASAPGAVPKAGANVEDLLADPFEGIEAAPARAPAAGGASLDELLAP